MIVAIHQPCFLPWPGYLARMATADLFIILDHVQFERRNYQNRTRIAIDGRAQWLTVPVRQISQQERIVDKRIDNPPAGETIAWGQHLSRTLRHAYRDAPFLDDYLPPLRRLLEQRHDSLVELNLQLLDVLREAFAIHTPLLRSSQLRPQGQRSALILDLCRQVGARTYLAGMGGSRHYLDTAAFAAAGINLAWQDYRPTIYRQCGSPSFLPGLSAIDLLFNHGPHSREIAFGPPAKADPSPPIAWHLATA